MKKTVIRVCIVCLFISGNIFSGDEKDKHGGTPESLPLNGEFYLAFGRLHPIQRDEYLESRLNKIVLCRGKIKSIDQIERYRRKFRIQCVDIDAGLANITVVYYVFVDKKDSIAMLSVGSLLEFTGQFTAYTPVNSMRSSYIFDVIFEKGAVLIE